MAKGDELQWWDVKNRALWTCPACHQTSPAAEWQESRVPCDDCGSHDGRECPRCNRAFDHVWGSERIEEASREATAKLKQWLLDELGWCGCWENAPLIVFRDYLRLRNLDCRSPDYKAKCDASFMETQARWLLAKDRHVAGLAYLIEGICQRLYLTEHGVSCRCSWLTDKGREVLAMLDAVEDFGKWAME